MAHQVLEAVGGRVRRAALLHELPLSDRVARAGEQAPPAGFAETERLGEWRVRLELGRGQHSPEEHTRAVLRRQQHQVEPERAQPGLDRSVRQGQRAAGVAGAVVEPGVGVHGRHGQRRVPVVLQEVDELELDLLEFRDDQLARVLLVTVVVALQPAEPAQQPPGQHDHAAGVVGRDRRRCLRPRGIGRIVVEDGARRDADEVGAELARLRLDCFGGDGQHGHTGSATRFAGGRYPSSPTHRIRPSASPGTRSPRFRIWSSCFPRATFSGVRSGISRWSSRRNAL